MDNFLQHLWADDSGQDLVEYVLIVVLIALAAIAAMTLLGGAINDVFNSAASTLSGQTT